MTLDNVVSAANAEMDRTAADVSIRELLAELGRRYLDTRGKCTVGFDGKNSKKPMITAPICPV